MKKEKINEEETIEMSVVPTHRVDEMEEDINILAEDVVQSRTETNLLRGQNKHCLRAGVVQIEIVPTEATTFKEIMEGFKDFMTTLKELHGNEHLVARIEGMDPRVMSDMKEGMFL